MHGEQQDTLAPLTVFYSYAHEDERLCRKLEKHLSLLRQQGMITEWHDREIAAGMDWAQAIDTHLDTAVIILLLVSPDFMASDYCYSKEMQRALDRHDAHDAHVIPVLLRPVDWENAPFARLHVLPTNALPVSVWKNQDEAFLDIARGIRKVIGSLRISSRSTSLLSQALWTVPYRRNPFFTGREALLTYLHEQLTTTAPTALTQPQAISGLGGIGKTQTALEYAYRYGGQYRYVFWVSAATAETLRSEMVKLITLLQVPGWDVQDQQQMVDVIKTWLAEQRDWLLILDNADDLAVVAEYLPQGSKTNGHILLTTRAQSVGSLAQTIEVDMMSKEEGTLLLLCRAKTLALAVPLEQANPRDRADAEAVVAAVDGLPLAIDQAGAYIEETGIGLSEYLKLYQTRRKDLLARRGPFPPGHPDTVATTWSLSFQQVEQTNPAAADLLRLCAFLAPDSIPEEILTEGAPHLGKSLGPVAADPIRCNEAVEAVRRYSFVRRNAETHTLSMHRLVQATLKDGMNKRTQKQWAGRTVRALNEVFLSVDAVTYSQAHRYLPHVEICSVLIEQYGLVFSEAAHLLRKHASYFNYTNQYEQAESLHKRALAILEKAVGLEDPQTAFELTNLALLYQTQGKNEQAELLLQQALAIREKALGPEHHIVAVALNNLARLYRGQWKYEQAEPLFLRALTIREKVLGLEDSLTALILNDLAQLYQGQGKYEQAEQFYQRALSIQEKVGGPEYYKVAGALGMLAQLYQVQGKYEQAEPLFLRAIAIDEKALGPEHDRTAIDLRNLASLYQVQGKYEQAEWLLQRAIAIGEKAVGPEHSTTARALGTLAQLYQVQGKYEQAEPLFLRALAIYEKVVGPENPYYTLSMLDGLAVFYQDQGKDEQAEPFFQRAIAIREEVFGPEHPFTAKILERYAVLLQRMKRESEAAPLEARAKAIRAKQHS